MNEIPGFDNRSVSQELTENLVLAAELYYIYDLPQKDIAARLGVSRPWVSKLLKRAEEIGIVRIAVNTNTAGISDIEKKLIDRYGLKNAKIVKTSSSDSSFHWPSARTRPRTLSRLYNRAARYYRHSMGLYPRRNVQPVSPRQLPRRHRGAAGRRYRA